MKAIFFSDVHLEKDDYKKKKLVTTFIKEVCGDKDLVFVLGDLFEFFYGYKNYIYPWYVEVVDFLKGLVEDGKKVFFLEGNHEFMPGKTLKAYGNIECARELPIEVDGKRLYLAHGNELIKNNPLKFLKSRVVYSIMEVFGPKLTWQIAMVSGALLSDKKKPYRESVKQKFREIAKEKLSEGFDVVIFAHTHMPDRIEFEINGSKKLYLNTGDLYKYHSYIEYTTDKGFNIMEYRI